MVWEAGSVVHYYLHWPGGLGGGTERESQVGEREKMEGTKKRNKGGKHTGKERIGQYLLTCTTVQYSF